ncbi:hypothetical protein Plhal304r1_c002g0008831 [Plasmopara halstedii]
MMGELGKVIKQNWLDGSQAQQVLRRHTNQTEWQCAKPLRLKFSFDTASKSVRILFTCTHLPLDIVS